MPEYLIRDRPKFFSLKLHVHCTLQGRNQHKATSSYGNCIRCSTSASEVTTLRRYTNLFIIKSYLVSTHADGQRAIA